VNKLREIIQLTTTDFWHVDTSGERGKIISTLCHGTSEGDGFWSYNVYGGGFTTLVSRRVPRVSAKLIKEAHDEGCKLGRALYAQRTAVAEVAPAGPTEGGAA
jgi:hypothetical protein